MQGIAGVSIQVQRTQPNPQLLCDVLMVRCCCSMVQGVQALNSWVTAFYVKTSKDGKEWNLVECGRLFIGNTDSTTKKNSFFSNPIKTRFVRIYPDSYYNWLPSMRAGLLMCDSKAATTVTSSWTMRLYSFNSPTNYMPDLSTSTPLGIPNNLIALKKCRVFHLLICSVQAKQSCP